MYDEWTNEEEDSIDRVREEERIRRHKARIQEMRRRKRRAEILQKRVFPAALAVFLIVAAAGIGIAAKGKDKEPEENESRWTEDGAAPSGGGQSGSQVLSEGDQPDDALRSEQEQSGNGPQADAYRAEPGQNGEALGKGGRRPRVQQTSAEAAGEIYGPFLPPEAAVFSATEDSGTAGFSEEIISAYGILIDVENEVILAQREGRSRMYPASMTKILTVLTAARALGIEGEDWRTAAVLDEKFTITIEITDYSFVNECSNVGFEVGEEVTVRDLFYGTILPSGADAALGLAIYTAGSHEAFVDLMNQELERLKLADSTHFTNCVGLYDPEHYSTVYDMAVILKTAADNPFCRDVLSARTYHTTATAQHPEGLLISNWFLRRIEDKDTHGEVICGKTGYVLQSRSCAASLATDGSGREYICVTGGSAGSSNCMSDQVKLYQTWLPEE
ncbi:MAG: serine hydrolase [Roseburia sp.]|nr:serine hydrolase [Roseburia sp.]MCM1096780.1 serine hydrolase [Ruminococcus flavefaciens]